jgi:hypothetical protein
VKVIEEAGGVGEEAEDRLLDCSSLKLDDGDRLGELS